MVTEKQGFPDDRDNELRRQAEDVYKAAEDIVDWAGTYAPERSGSDFAIDSESEFELLQLRRRAARLLGSARIPVAAAVYGASQVGKSLFVGRILEPAHVRDSPLGKSEQVGPPAYIQELSFRDDINPQSGSNEATALVTRFTTKERFGASLNRYPVKVRALTRAEWLCVMARGFRSECKKPESVPWNEKQVRDLFEEVHRGQAADTGPTNRKWRRDLLDVYTHLRNIDRLLYEITEPKFNYFLNTYPLTEAGYVEIAGRMFWDSKNFPSLTAFFNEICQFLDKITPTDTDTDTVNDRDGILVDWTAVRFLLDSQRAPKHTNPETNWAIKEVAWNDLVDRFEDGWYVLDYQPGAGPPKVKLEVIQSAMLEMIIPVIPHRLKDDWRDVILKMDILDLPGMRAGGGDGKGGAAAISTTDEKMNVVKRGKVAYLFDRYIEERQVQTLLLLVKGGNLEVRQSLKEYINKWGAIRYGKDAWLRRAPAASPALFIGMTGIDDEFKDRQPARNLYEARLKNLATETLQEVMTDFGGSGQPFTNVFPIRYPGSWDCNNEKQRLAPGGAQKWQDVRKIFLESDMVKKYVRDPEIKWDVAMRDNDGGLSLISQGFIDCTTSLQKQDALQTEIIQVRQALSNLVKSWYCDPNTNQDRDKRAAMAKRVVEWLVEDGKVYQRVWALKESLTLRPDDVLEIAEHSDGPLSRQRTRPESRDSHFPKTLKEFLERWARELAPQRWRDNIAADQSGAPWLSVDELSVFARYLCEYLCSKPDFDELVTRLLEVIRPVRDEGDRRNARRDYVRLILNDHVLNPGSDDLPLEAVAPTNGHDYGLMQPFIARWQSRLATKLSSAGGSHKEIPAGNDELKPFLSDTIH